MNTECNTILDILGFNYTCTEEEKKNLASKLFELRKEAIEQANYSNNSERVMGSCQVENIGQINPDWVSQLDAVIGMLKFWSPSHFNEFIRQNDLSLKKTLRETVEKFFIESSQL